MPADQKQTLDWYGQAADNGEKSSMFYLGTYHMTISRDYAKAIFNFVRAGEKRPRRSILSAGVVRLIWSRPGNPMQGLMPWGFLTPNRRKP
jgi:TPR repeat protein